MKYCKRILITGLLALLFSQAALAASGFIVRHIRVQGLQRISESTVLSYVPVSIGQRFTARQSASTIKVLFQTGFFNNVRLLRSGNTLVIKVHERPTISLITIKGNHKIKTKLLKKALFKLGIIEGNVFDSSKLHSIKTGLKEQYGLLGRYAATVTTQVVQEPRNTVAIHIIIHEGPTATVHSINFIGNHAFSSSKLRGQFKLSTPGLFSFLNHNDRYSKTKLDADLLNLTNFYHNHGYWRFRIVKRQVVMSADHKRVAITITIFEGPVYIISGYRINAPTKDRAIIAPMITLQKGHVFRRIDIIATNNYIAEYYANHGYAFPYIKALPSFNDVNHTVFITFTINPKQRVYIRHINFLGNNRTADYVLRSQLTQMEASQFKLSDIKESRRKLANLPYLTNIQVTPTKVPGRPDLVDLDYHANEINAGRASLSGGYSDTQGIIYGANVSEPNFLGSGKYVSLGFQSSSYSSNYTFSYNNPFFTVDGVQRGYSIYYTHTKPSAGLNLETYSMDDFGGTLNYSIPLSEYDQLGLGVGFDQIKVKNLPVTAPAPVTAFLNIPFNAPPAVRNVLLNNGKSFTDPSVILGFSHSTLDRAVFPTMGSLQILKTTIGAPVFGSSLGFYKATYNGKWFFPLGGGFIINPHTILGVGGGIGGNGGTSSLPFFYNYFGGGIQTLPGFKSNTLGPKNPITGNLQALGGNVEILGGFNFIFPNPFSQRLRTALILDFGNIFQTSKIQNPLPAPQVNYESISVSNLRASVGLMVTWYSPLGPISLSVAQAIRKKAGDQVTLFGFTFGANV